MKQGWKICKLGEVCEIARGGSPRPIEKYITDSANGINWIKIGDAEPGSKYILRTEQRIVKEGLKKSRYVKKGDFILSNSMSFGRPYILQIDGCIHDGWLVIHDTNNIFDKSYLYYYLSSPSIYLEFKRLAVGGVVNNLNSELVRNVDVAIPPLSVQQQIVSELDLLTSIINKKKAQLDELNKLAQATFYDMFGDPVENEKGWEVKKLGESTSIVGGYAFKSDLFTNKGIPVLRIGNINSGTLKDENICYYSEDVKLSRYVVYPQDLVMSLTGTVGKDDYGNVCVLPNTYEKYYLNQRNAKIEIHNSLIVRYLQYLLTDKKIKTKITGNSRGVRQANISNKDLETLPIPLPPLPLQQQFAQKIELIESQKSKIKASLAETQTLLDATMDRYFG